MIAWLSGTIINKKPALVVIETGGVGYLVHVSLPTFYSLGEEGEPASLFIHTYVKEDAFQLFGFATDGEKEIFNRLIGVNKVGPKLAITILSGMAANELLDAVNRKDIAKLSSVPGIGKKTAERLILELSDKLADLMAGLREEGEGKGGPGIHDDAVSALISLGYKKSDSQKAVETAHARLPDGALEDILKQALNFLAG